MSSFVRLRPAFWLSAAMITTLLGGDARAESCPAEYSEYERKDDLLACARDVPQSDYREYRVSVRLGVPPAQAAQRLWQHILDGKFEGLKQRRMLVKHEHELVFYDQLKTAVVADRDYTLRVVRTQEGDATVFRFNSRNDLGPPPDGEHVRMPVVKVTWRITPAAAGSTLTVTTFSEPGGKVSTHLVRHTQAKRAISETLDLVSLFGSGK